MNQCEKCGSEDFYEEDGFNFCCHCQTQSQGFAKEVADVEDNVQLTREIRVAKSSGKKEARKRHDENQSNNQLNSSWNTLEAFNEIYLNFVKDFLKILEQNNLKLPEKLRDRFISISMQIWFKYLRESEIAFVDNEHENPEIKLHPLSRYRDNFLLNKPPGDESKLPNYKHSKIHMPEADNNFFCMGTNYTVKKDYEIDPLKSDYYNHDILKDKTKDPRIYFKKNYCRSRKQNAKNVNKLLSEINTRESPTPLFLNYIKNVTNDINDDEQIQMDYSPIFDKKDIESENLEVNQEQSNDEAYHKNLLKNRMSKKMKAMNEIKKIESIRHGFKQTPFYNDFINRTKLLAFLFITIRLFNFNIYLSDLIRWCISGNIRFMNLLPNLQEKNKEIMWFDLFTFINYNIPNYESVVGVARNMIIHCRIDPNLFPEPDLYALIHRYLKDLNLPKDLFGIIKAKYKNFIEYYSSKKMLLIDMRRFTEYDIIAMIPILLTLKSLFGLEKTTENNYMLFKHFDHSSELFIWNDWLYYSRIRFNLIKAFHLNMLPSHCDTINLDEILWKNYEMYDFFRDVQIKAHEIDKNQLHQTRFKLLDRFEKLFFEPENFDWKQKTFEFRASPSLHPLTTCAATVLSKISNSHFKQILTMNFRDKLSKPYCCKHNYYFHRPQSLFMDKHKLISIEEFSDSFRHLIDLATFITNAKYDLFLSLFVTAERFSFDLTLLN